MFAQKNDKRSIDSAELGASGFCIFVNSSCIYAEQLNANQRIVTNMLQNFVPQGQR
jgi:hypothetical protein